MKTRILIPSTLVLTALLFAAIQPAFAQQDQRTAAIEAALDVEASLEFQGNPFRDVMQYLSSREGIPILIDENALQDAGLSADEEVSLVVNGITLRSALDIMLESVAGVPLDYVIQHQVLKITTREKADSILETRVYNVKQLQTQVFDAHALANVIRKTVRPESWAHIEIVSAPASGEGYEEMMNETMDEYAEGYGGRIDSAMGMSPMQITKRQQAGHGSIEPLPGCLVVTQSQRVHRAIADLLEQLEGQLAHE